MKELLEHLNKIYVEQLSNCSEICRKIVFALFAVTWGLCYSNSGFNFSIFFLLVFFLLTIYLVLDVLQFYLTAMSYRTHFYRIQDVANKGELEDDIKRMEKIKRKMINDKSFKLMKLKMYFLPLSFLMLLLGIIEKVINMFANT